MEQMLNISKNQARIIHGRNLKKKFIAILDRYKEKIITLMLLEDADLFRDIMKILRGDNSII